MNELVPVVFALFAWWFGTGLVLWLGRQKDHYRRWILVGAVVASLISTVLIVLIRDVATATGAYVGFACAVVIWGALEMSCYLGYLIGPRRSPCPLGAKGFKRLRYAIETVILHECAVAIVGALIWIACWDTANQTAALAYSVLWVMRVSAKVNMFLGVRNRYEHWLPEKVKYQISYCRDRSINWLLPWSITIGTIAGAWGGYQVMTAELSHFDIVNHTVVSVLILLAVLEHWLLVLPLSIERVWSWVLEERIPSSVSEVSTKV